MNHPAPETIKPSDEVVLANVRAALAEDVGSGCGDQSDNAAPIDVDLEVTRVEHACPETKQHDRRDADSDTVPDACDNCPLIANVTPRPLAVKAWCNRQKPTRMPYSCHAQLGKSGCSGAPIGGDKTVRGIGRDMDQCSTLTMIHTRTRAGAVSLGRSTIAE